MDSNEFITTVKRPLVVLTKSGAKADEKRVLLKVHDSVRNHDSPYFYLIGRNTPLGELMFDYTTERKFDNLNNSRFLFDGSLINPSSSANSLKLENGDSIDVIRRDGYKVSNGTATGLISLPRAKGEFPITLKLRESINGKHITYLFGRNTPLEVLFFDYVDRFSRFYDYAGFYNICNGGRRIDPEKTADDLKFEDGDTILVKTIDDCYSLKHE